MPRRRFLKIGTCVRCQQTHRRIIVTLCLGQRGADGNSVCRGLGLSCSIGELGGGHGRGVCRAQDVAVDSGGVRGSGDEETREQNRGDASDPNPLLTLPVPSVRVDAARPPQTVSADTPDIEHSGKSSGARHLGVCGDYLARPSPDNRVSECLARRFAALAAKVLKVNGSSNAADDRYQAGCCGRTPHDVEGHGPVHERLGGGGAAIGVVPSDGPRCHLEPRPGVSCSAVAGAARMPPAVARAHGGASRGTRSRRAASLCRGAETHPRTSRGSRRGRFTFSMIPGRSSR